jgi:hypothetical protein|tara:strand:- start:26001 stop:26312 length:312 start_codon:yes stop_codon:yes gene_type:complete
MTEEPHSLEDSRIFDRIADVKRIGKQVDEISKTLNGNGHPGLKSRVDLLESNNVAMKQLHEDNGKKIDRIVEETRKLNEFKHTLMTLAGFVGFALGLAIPYFK